MIVVKVELHSAITGEVTELGRTIIANTGGTHDRGDYTAKVGRKGCTDNRTLWEKPLREGKVTDYPRLSYNVWRLVIRGLKAAFPEEK